MILLCEINFPVHTHLQDTSSYCDYDNIIGREMNEIDDTNEIRHYPGIIM